MKTLKLTVVAAILACSFQAAKAQISIGVRFGTPIPRRVVIREPVYDDDECIERPVYQEEYYERPVYRRVIVERYPRRVTYYNQGYYRRPEYRQTYYRHERYERRERDRDDD